MLFRSPLSLNPLRLARFEVIDPVHAAICRITASGVTMVAAAGNDAFDAENTLPAAYPEVLAVSAFTDTDGMKSGQGPHAACYPSEADDSFASYSNFGRVIDFAAPGTCTATTYPGNLYTVDVGTSLAAPHVAGAVALIRARQPFLPPLVVRQLLELRGERNSLTAAHDGIAEPIVNVRGF